MPMSMTSGSSASPALRCNCALLGRPFLREIIRIITRYQRIIQRWVETLCIYAIQDSIQVIAAGAQQVIQPFAIERVLDFRGNRSG